MSVPFVVAWRKAVLDPEGPLTSTERLVALVLAHHMTTDGSRCYPSRELLAGEAELSRATVGRALTALRRGGYLHAGKKSSLGTRMHHPAVPNAWDARLALDRDESIRF